MNKIVFASNNNNKIQEFRDLFSQKTILSLDDIGFYNQINETGKTLEENALIKVREVFNFSQLVCVSDDSGLEIDFLNGKPGVFSARYAGLKAKPIDNIKKVLKNLIDISNRKARFRTIIAFKDFKRELLFEGVVEGRISNNIQGEYGFGYDPIFIPNGFDITFSEMQRSLKNKISHRGLAIKKLNQFILSQ